MKWIKALIGLFNNDEAAKARVAAGVRACADCINCRGGTHGIEEYCVAITVHDVVSGTQKFVHCSSARLSSGDCGPGGKLWKPRKGLISCPR